ncbi:MAG TPA: hypothetical protein VGP22_10500 [Albitalea sp.]|nr:hypothetical protein [Albitalea sp.]
MRALRRALQALAAGIALTVPLLSACASLPAGLRLDDIVSVPLTPTGPRSTLAMQGGPALTAAHGEEPLRVRREEVLRRELGVDHAPDGSWNGCFVRGWGEGC